MVKRRDCPEGISMSMWILHKEMDFNFILKGLPGSKEFAVKTHLKVKAEVFNQCVHDPLNLGDGVNWATRYTAFNPSSFIQGSSASLVDMCHDAK